MANYVTHCYDSLRTGWNPDETILTPDSVWLHLGGPTYLGRLFAYQVQGQVYAQPLYAENVNFPGGSKDAVFVATEENRVYAFDAGSTQQMWARQLIPAGEQLVKPSDIEGCGNIQPFIGITSTPVIDPASMTMYVVAKTRSTANSTLFHHRLYALALEDGQDRTPPNVIQATVPNPRGGTISFNPQWQLQRPALLLMNGVIHIGFGGHCDFHPGTYHGWVVAHDAATLNPVGAFASTVSGLGGIWQAGRGLAGDAQGSVYCMTGNGPVSAAGNDHGDTVLKLGHRPGNPLGLQDYFTPCDQQFLVAHDIDLGSGGPLLLPDQPGPHPHLLVAAGKEGTVYLLNRDHLGEYTPPPSGWHYPQECSNAAISTLWYVLGTRPPLPPGTDKSRDALFGGPAYYAPAGTNPRIYYCGQGDVVKAFSYDQVQGRLVGPFDRGKQVIANGSIPVVSSNGGTTGVLWVLSRGNPRVLTAYDPDPSRSLSSAPLCDITVGTWTGSLGPPATVVNGRVYAACDDQVVVFGLVPTVSTVCQAGRNTDGRLEVFARGADSALWHIWQITPGGPDWSAGETLAPGTALTSDPAVGINADGRLEVFARGADNALWHIWQITPGGPDWSAGETLAPGTALTSDPAVGINADGRLEVFARGADNALWHIWQITPGGPDWSAGETLAPGTALTSDPAVGINADGRLEVFARGADNALWHIWQTAPNNGWSAGATLAPGTAINSDLEVGINADGRLEVFARGTDNALWHIWQTAPNNGWTGGATLAPGTALTSDPEVGINADGRLEVFARGTDNALWHIWQTAPNNGWTGGATLAPGTALTSDPEVGINADGRLEVFARGTDNALWHIWQTVPNNGWSGGATLGGDLMNS